MALAVYETVAAMRAARETWSGPVGFVPTMGYLHAGHISLVRHARDENDTVVASIFLNPTQFGPNEDLSKYPRDLPHDLAFLEEAGVHAVFAPTIEQMYPPGYFTYVEPMGTLAEHLEAVRRPGHFRGVATVVTKLFNIVAPHHAYFGQKDAQQVAVLRALVRDLNMPLALHVLPTIREEDGLAMSSRNSYLNITERAAATVLSRALRAGQAAVAAAPDGDANAVRAAMREVVAAAPLATLDYADVCDPDTFEPLATMRTPALLAIAARIGHTRLIDNFLLKPDGTWETGHGVAHE